MKTSIEDLQRAIDSKDRFLLIDLLARPKSFSVSANMDVIRKADEVIG